MKTTIAKLINSDKALSNLLEQKLSLGISIQLGKVVQELEPVFKKANEARLEILQRYGVEVIEDDKPTGQYKINPDNFKVFETEMKEAFEQEIELAFPTFSISKLPEACLIAKDVISLSWLFEEGSVVS